MVMNQISKLLSLNSRAAHIARLTLPIVLLASSATFAADGDSDAISAYLASKQVVASQDLASQIANSGRTTCAIAFVTGYGNRRCVILFLGAPRRLARPAAQR